MYKDNYAAIASCSISDTIKKRPHACILTILLLENSFPEPVPSLAQTSHLILYIFSKPESKFYQFSWITRANEIYEN